MNNGQREFERLEQEDDWQRAVASEARNVQLRLEAKERAQFFRLPRLAHPPDPDWNARKEMDLEPPVDMWRISGMAGVGDNVAVVAREKAGKTTLGLNLAKALVDGSSFLGHYKTTRLSGSLLYINYEMTKWRLREWARLITMERADMLVFKHVRGQSLPLWMPDVGELWAEWCYDRGVQAVIIDPAAHAWRGIVTSESDNSMMVEFLSRLDSWKAAAGISELFLLHHMPKGEQQQDEETGRGAVALHAWADSNWVLTKEDGGTRYLRASGRDVEIEAMALTYNKATRTLTLTGRTREQEHMADDVRRMIDVLLGEDGMSSSELGERTGIKKERRSKILRECVTRGYIERQYENGEAVDEESPKRGVKMLCFVTASGRSQGSVAHLAAG